MFVIKGFVELSILVYYPKMVTGKYNRNIGISFLNIDLGYKFHLVTPC